MEKSFVIDGLITVDENWNSEEFLYEFVRLIELKGWSFGGTSKEYTKEDEQKDIGKCGDYLWGK
jgi:hypothetical protein